jgi:hypothetical protein
LQVWVYLLYKLLEEEQPKIRGHETSVAKAIRLAITQELVPADWSKANSSVSIPVRH